MSHPETGRIYIDAATRIVLSDAISLREGLDPVAWAEDRILILDAASGRPLAVCQPLPRPKPPPAPSPSVQGKVDGLLEARAARQQAAPAEPINPSWGGGRLSEAHKEKIERLWINGLPGRTGQRVAEEFLAQTGRRISADVAEKYRPEAPQKNG